MATKHISFRQMFDAELTGITHVVIPKIQRAYAQGRTDARTSRTRQRFLDTLHDAVVSGSPLTLDFIYGNNANGKLTPLDGQQRLTTLFLLHWYAAKKAGTDASFLNRFTYETRYSARDFCSKLVDYDPEWSDILSAEIKDQAWFPLDWTNDATIAAMLVMLDDINTRFADVDNLWDSLDNIKFHFLPIDQMGLTDDIYIKMNSRGKPLTEFEHFKAEFEKALKAIDKQLAERIAHKIDVDWTDMLWPYKGDNNIIDDEFLRFFRFVCDILCYLSGGSPRQNDEFALIDEYFRGPDARKNVEMLEQFFDCWNHVDHKALFDEFITAESHEPGKILIRQASQKYLFQDCLRDYADVLGNHNRRFTLNQIILLYAFTLYRLHSSEIPPAQFARRLRIIYNLILNSADEISDSESRTGGNRMPAILKQVDSIVLKGEILDRVTLDGDDDDAAARINFNVNQLEEEKQKLQFTASNPDLAESLFKLEDHEILRGQISIVGLDHPERFERFATLFNCDWDKVCRALISISDCGRRYRNWRLDLGTASRTNHIAWRELFDKSNTATGYDNLKETLGVILGAETITDDTLDEISDSFIAECEGQSRFPWRYYYVNYPAMRAAVYGRYTQQADNPYQMIALMTRWKESQKSFSVFLNELGRVDPDSYGHCIIVNDNGDMLLCENSAYVLKSADGTELNRTPVPQSADGIDTIDRVAFALAHYSEITTPNRQSAVTPPSSQTSLGF